MKNVFTSQQTLQRMWNDAQAYGKRHGCDDPQEAWRLYLWTWHYKIQQLRDNNWEAPKPKHKPIRTNRDVI